MDKKKSWVKIVGKTIVIVGAVVGLLSIFLSFILPQYFGWYRIEGSVGGSVVIGLYITGLGTITTIGPPGGPSGIVILELIGGIIFMVGAILCIIGVLLPMFYKEIKALNNVGGILMLVAPLFLIIDVQIISGPEFRDFISTLAGSPTAVSMFWGSIRVGPDAVINWGIWIGSFTAFGAGVLGLVGGSL